MEGYNLEKNMVRKSNDVIEACYDMSVPELRLIYSCISKIEFRQIIDSKQMFTISANEYSKTFGVDHSNASKELKKAVDKMWMRDITIKRANEPDLVTRWISAKASWGDGRAEIRFAIDVIPYLTNLLEIGNFTIYELDNIGGLKSSYGIRIYELLIQYKAIGERKINLQELREILCLGSKYKAMCDLRKRVLEPAVKEINEQTDLKVSYKNVKRGRSIIALHFTIKNKRKTPKITPKNPKKYLSPEDIYKEFQKPRFKNIQSYNEGFKILEKEGYTLNRTAFMIKYKC